ncbi:MAG: CsgG/HfaB family protein [Treponema sp.]|nr:CsgG/HfaB family protein [Treponema sp.]
MKRTFMLLFIAASALSGGFVFADTELYIERNESKINSGFKERIYIDGKNRLTLANGKSGVVTIPDGVHKIYAELYTMKTDELPFNASGGIIQINITANSINDFVITLGGGAPMPTRPAAGANSNGSVVQRPIGQSTLEAALYTAADVIIARLQPKTTIAVVSIASRDIESAEFVLDELAYVIVSSGGFKVVDRKSLEAIRSEQNFQSSGEVDDDSAVSIGKLLGANIVITGSISGVGSTRRLRLKALNVTTAEITAMASEAY